MFISDMYLEDYESKKQKINSVAWVREWTLPSERPPLVEKVSANFFGYSGVTWSARRIPYGLNLGFIDRSRYFFFQVAPQLYSRSWVDPVPDPQLLRKSGSTGNRTRSWICRQELWPLDHGESYFTGLLPLLQQHADRRLWQENMCIELITPLTRGLINFSADNSNAQEVAMQAVLSVHKGHV
jgi:hypothetical protein